MDFSFSPAQKAFREEVRAFARAEVTPQMIADVENAGDEQHHPQFWSRLASRGWLGLQLPKQYGGLALGNVEASILYEELEHALAPIGRLRATVVFVGHSILAFGNDRQKQEYLPRIASGEITGAWLLTEPGAGSDAASLRTRAAQAGNEWVINGEKIFTSGAQGADLGMVAARTDPHARTPYEGISLFLVPLRSPGLTIRPIRTSGGWSVNQEFFDDVRVPASAMLGELNKGWANITKYTLNFERASISRSGTLLRVADELGAFVAKSGSPASRQLRHQLAELRADIVAARWLGYRISWLYDQGQVPSAESSMIKVITAELLHRLADLGTDILGYAGQVRGTDAPLAGRVEFFLRSIWFHLVGGGTPDIQRNVIAQWGLGLPRERERKKP